VPAVAPSAAAQAAANVLLAVAASDAANQSSGGSSAFSPAAAAPAAAPAAGAPAPSGTSGAGPSGTSGTGEDDVDCTNDPDLYESDADYEHELDDEPPEYGEDEDPVSAWRSNDNFKYGQRELDGMDRKRDPVFNMPNYETKGILDYAKFFLPMEFIGLLAKKMEDNGKAKYDGGKGDPHYKNWTVSVDDVLQWIGLWIYRLAWPQIGGWERYFQGPEGGVGPQHDLKRWLKIGKPGTERVLRWLQQMQACFELPTYGRSESDDPFNPTRRFWDSLRDAFFAAVECSHIMCLDESMVSWVGRGMPGFMHVQRKPTPKGLELHTLCCGICGILLFFEVYEGKKAMEKKEHCAELKTRLGAQGPWRSVSLTIRMVERFANKGRILIADSWFGSVPCVLELFTLGIYAIMQVKTTHKDYPKDALLGKLGYSKKDKVCPKERRGEHYGYERDYTTHKGEKCKVLAAGHNSKKPVLVVSTAESLGAAPDYQKTYTRPQPDGSVKKFVLNVATTFVHALYHAYFFLVDVHNHLRQGETSMAEVWATQSWADRHFAEGLGFWEVNVFKALTYFHPDHKTLQHPRFRVLLAHALLTLGKVEFGTDPDGHSTTPSAPDDSYCRLGRFKDEDGETINAKHQCGYCKERAYLYCTTCFPDGITPMHACCNPNTGRPCFAKHVLKEKCTHAMHFNCK